VLYIFVIGMYKLMVGPLNVPDYVMIETIDDLKSKLASILILIIAITFTKEVVEWESPLDLCTLLLLLLLRWLADYLYSILNLRTLKLNLRTVKIKLLPESNRQDFSCGNTYPNVPDEYCDDFLCR